MSMLDQLIEMGFPLEMAKKSLEETNEKSLEDALDWLENRGNSSFAQEPMDFESATDRFADAEAGEPKLKIAEVEAQPGEAIAGDVSNGSLGAVEKQGENVAETSAPKEITFKCNECGKLLKGELEVMFHAGKTQHDVFSESTEQIKPLTEEEKQKRALEMREKIKTAMMKKEEKERQEQIEKEKKRRLEGQATAEMLERRKEMEIKQIAEQRKREKQEEVEAKRRVLEQIRVDREARKRSAEPKADTIASMPQTATLKGTSTDAEYCNLQIRLPNGTAMKEKFKSNETLAAVKLWVELNRKDPEDLHYPFTLMVPFPRQIFTLNDMEKPLKALGLVPSACLVVTRAPS